MKSVNTDRMIPPAGGRWIIYKEMYSWSYRCPSCTLYVGRGIQFTLRMSTCCILAALKPKSHFSNCEKNNVLVS